LTIIDSRLASIRVRADGQDSAFVEVGADDCGRVDHRAFLRLVLNDLGAEPGQRSKCRKVRRPVLPDRSARDVGGPFVFVRPALLRCVGEDPFVIFESNSADSMGEIAVTGPAVVVRAGSTDLLQPIADMHEAQGVEVLVRNVH
jgi:hypothetical protein